MGKYSNSILTHKTNIIIIIVLLSLLVAVAGYIYYNNETNTIRQEKYESIKAIAELKIDQLVKWHKEQTSNALVVSRWPMFVKRVEEWLSDKNNPTLTKNIITRLSEPKKLYGYEAIFLTSVNGDFLLGVGSESEQFDPVVSNKIREAAEKQQITYTDFYYCNTEKKIHYDVIAPLLNEKERIIAALIFRVNPNDYLYPFIQSWPTSSKTSETLLLRRDRDRVLFLNELQHRKNTALSLTIPLTRKELPEVKAVLGYRGIYEGKDYRNVDVLSYVGTVPGTQWFMITQIDKSELFEELYFKITVIILFTLLIIITIAVGLAFIYNYRQRNIYKTLYKTQEEFHTTLYSIGDAVITTDNEGRVKYLNPIAEQLTGWKENDATGKSLSKVFKIINEDSRHRVENPVQKVLSQGAIVGLTNHSLLISKDGKEIPIADSGAPIKNKKGEIIGVVLVFRDQTEERAKQKIIEESEAKYRSLFLSTNDGICLHEIVFGENGKPLDYIILDANNKYEDITGIRRADAIGNKATEVYKSATAPYIDIYSKVALGGEPVTFETYFEPMQKYFLISVFSPVKGKFATVFQDITERKLAEESIKKSEALFRTTLYSIADAVIITDKESRIKHLNQVAEQLTGWEEQDAKGKQLEKIFDILNEETMKKTESPVEKVLRDGLFVGLTNHTLVISKDGRKIPISDSGAPIKNEAGEITGVVLVFRDETRERAVQKLIRESEAKYRYIFETTNEGICIADIEEIITSVNPRMAKMLGYSTEELFGMNFKELLPEDELQDHLAKKEKRYKDISEIYERKLRKKDGSTIWTLVSASPIIDENGNYNGAFGMFADITSNKLAEEEIRKLYRGVEQSPVMTLITDTKGNIEFVNAKFCEVTEYSFEEVIGKNTRILNSGKHSKEFYKNLWGTILSGHNFISEMQNKKKNGELYWESASISPVKNSSGEVTHFIAFKEDITERKKMLEELTAAKEKAEEMNRIKTIFFTNMSHELRTPFVGIIGYAELLSEIVNDPVATEMVNGIYNSSIRLTKTLSKILDFTKLEFNKVEVNLKDTDILSIINDVYKQFKVAAIQKNLVLKKEINLKPLLIKTDEKLITEILNNLLNNAIKFTETGFIKIVAALHKTDNIKFMIIKVQDTGIGIPKDKQDIIWEEFRQVSEGTTRSHQGTGLGLSITKKYTELIGGRIFVESEEGEGSTFIVELPISDTNPGEVFPLN